MSVSPRGPKVLKGALVSVASGAQPSVIAFQYNPATLRRDLRPQLVGGDENDRSEAIRYTGAPVQTITVDIELDATDQLDQGDSVAESLGILPQLSALELLAYPSLSAVSRNQSKIQGGVMEVAPLTAPRTLFVWGSQRVLPVRLTSYSINEEAFDRWLHPIRAGVTVAMRVLNYSDLDSGTKEYHQFAAYQTALEVAARLAPAVDPATTLGANPSSF